jgi:hypothetical protein
MRILGYLLRSPTCKILSPKSLFLAAESDIRNMLSLCAITTIAIRFYLATDSREPKKTWFCHVEIFLRTTRTKHNTFMLIGPRRAMAAPIEAEGITDLLILVTNVAYSCYNSNT